ncbi:glycosyltransferase [Schleiferiaceae bacterium]|nr:glycosyltransferase [Schleiferiaceae bacterium]
MNIWLITIGEPIMHAKNKLRLHRTGILAKRISDDTDHNVTWWTSGFNHFTKKNVFNEDTVLQVNEKLKIIAINGGGYQSNVSLSRIRDHKVIAKKFKSLCTFESIPDIIVVSFPTLGLCQAALEYGKNFNVPVLLDYRDMWPEEFLFVLPKTLRPLGRIVLTSLFLKTKNVFRMADGLIAITQEFLNIGLNKSGRKMHSMDAVYPLGYLEKQYDKIDLVKADDFWRSMGLSKDRIRICFFGTIGHQYDLETVIKASKLPGGEKYQFIICGSGDNLLRLKSINGENPGVVFPGYMSAAQIKSLMDTCEYGLCPYVPKEAFLNSMPGKVFEYLSTGLPIIGTLGNGVLGKFLNEHKIGVSYTANSPESLLEGLRSLAMMNNCIIGEKIIEIFNSQFSAEVVYSDYIRHLEAVVDRYKCLSQTKS